MEIFDYTIIGLGAAGMQLALKMAEDPFFDSKKILLIEKNSSSKSKRTWCFWEEKEGKCDHLIEKRWDNALFIGLQKTMEIPLKQLSYKMLNSEIFFKYGLKKLKEKNNFQVFFEEVTSTTEKENRVEVQTNKHSFQSKFIFDSKVSTSFYKKNNYINIKQHFKGWFIKVDNPIFNDGRFTMMDFSVAYNNTTSFMYMLPISKTLALFEYTFFTPEPCEENLYDKLIENYIATKFPSIKNYKIVETETGIIPMSTYPFETDNTNRILKIGTAGGWVRASTGYSFKRACSKSQTIINNIKNQRKLTSGLYPKKELFYDRLLLDIINTDNSTGPKLFETLFAKNDIQKALQFLDGETGLFEELKITTSFPWLPFIKAIYRQYFQ